MLNIIVSHCEMANETL